VRWDEVLEIYAFSQWCGLRLILGGVFGLGLRFWLAPVGYWRLFVNAILLSDVRRDRAKKILDVSSPKLMSLMLAAQGADVVATDLDDPRIFDRWKRSAEILGLSPQYTAAFQDAQHLTYADASFDLVYSISVVEHIPGCGDRQAIREMLRVLRPGGMALIEVPFRSSYAEHCRDTNSRGAPATTPVFYERHYDMPALRERLMIEHIPCEIVLLGERMPIDPWLAANRLPRLLRLAISPFEPLLACLNYTVAASPQDIKRPLAAILKYRKPLSLVPNPS